MSYDQTTTLVTFNIDFLVYVYVRTFVHCLSIKKRDCKHVKFHPSSINAINSNLNIG